MPYLLLFGIIELTLIYWTQKYVLYKRANRPKDIDFDFSLKMTRIFDLMIFILTFGYFIFEVIIVKKSSIFTLLLFGFAVFSAVASEGISRLKIFSKKREGNVIPFDEAHKGFANDYDRLNPITQREAVMEWLYLMDTKAISLKSIRHIKDVRSNDINSKIFTSISKYVVQSKHYGQLTTKLTIPEKDLAQIPQDNHDSAIINPLELNYYKLANSILERQKSIIYKQKFIDKKSKIDINHDQLFNESKAIVDSQIMFSEYFHNHNLSNEAQKLDNGFSKKSVRNLEEIKEEKEDINMSENSTIQNETFRYETRYIILNDDDVDDISQMDWNDSRKRETLNDNDGQSDFEDMKLRKFDPYINNDKTGQ